MQAKSPNNYAFIDANNLHTGALLQRIPLDYRKFRSYLYNKYHITKAFMFIGYDSKNSSLYGKLKRYGYTLIFKPTIPYVANGKHKLKGNVDAELVLHAAAIEYDNYDKAVIVSSDGDFACLLKFLEEKDKLETVITPTKYYSMLLNPYRQYVTPLKSIWENLLDEE